MTRRPAKALRVLVVDDSTTVRHVIADSLADEGFDVVGMARTGDDAVRLCAELRPDVISMDMAMPGSDGLTATRAIMATMPTPILIVSASINRHEALRTMDALTAGALDIHDKPHDGADPKVWATGLAAKLRILSRVPVVRHIQPLTADSYRPPVSRVPSDIGGVTSLIAIGASTGGPTAVRTVLSSLDKAFPIPVVVAMHLHEGFAASLVEWLSDTTSRNVRLVTQNARLDGAGADTVWIAPPDRHLELHGRSLRLVEGPREHGCRPSVDRFFRSLVHVAPAVTAVLLTGMGADGASGLRTLREQGAWTIAQDEETSVVWGMPGEAVRLDAATEILPLQQIAPRLNSRQQRT